MRFTDVGFGSAEVFVLTAVKLLVPVASVVTFVSETGAVFAGVEVGATTTLRCDGPVVVVGAVLVGGAPVGDVLDGCPAPGEVAAVGCVGDLTAGALMGFKAIVIGPVEVDGPVEPVGVVETPVGVPVEVAPAVGLAGKSNAGGSPCASSSVLTASGFDPA
jgi:hypothetical protein